MRPRKNAKAAIAVHVVVPNTKGEQRVIGVWCQSRWKRLGHWLFRIKSIALCNRVPTFSEAWTGAIQARPLVGHPNEKQLRAHSEIDNATSND